MQIFPMLQRMTAAQVARQPLRPGDRILPDGSVVCGRCGKYRRLYKLFPNPSPEEPGRKTPLLVTVACACDEAEEAAEKERRKAQRDQEILEQLRAASLMDQRYADARLSTFRVTDQNRKLYNLVGRYVERFHTMLERNQGLLLWGDVGTGKTYAAAVIANELMDRKIPVMMTSFVKLIQLLQNKDSAEEVISKLKHAKLAIFDDFGAERKSDYVLEQVYNIVDSRYRAGLPMILTTNRSMKEMQEETDVRYQRIYDRVFETCYTFAVQGRSWRKYVSRQNNSTMEELLFGD